jgi:hypothetical protein
MHLLCQCVIQSPGAPSIQKRLVLAAVGEVLASTHVCLDLPLLLLLLLLLRHVCVAGACAAAWPLLAAPHLY